MKKLPILIAMVAALGTTAFADDQHLQRRLATDRNQTANAQAATIAVSANGRGVGRSTASQDQQSPRFELRSTAHGQVYGAYIQ